MYRSERDCIKHLGSRLSMFRTWIIRQCNTVWVCKLTDIVTCLWLGIIVPPKELFYEILVFWTYYMTSIWNKWTCERVNKSLDSYSPKDYYDINYNNKRKISISFRLVTSITRIILQNTHTCILDELWRRTGLPGHQWWQHHFPRRWYTSTSCFHCHPYE